MPINWAEAWSDRYTNLRGANLSKADLSGARLRKADLSGANLSGANLSSTNLSNAKLFAADLSNANLAFSNLFEANLLGVDLINADLTEANLNSAVLLMANLSDVNLSNADLSEAKLNQANLRGANLRGANLRGTNLSEAYLILADLKEVDLSEADLTGAILPISEKLTSSTVPRSVAEPKLAADNTKILRLRVVEEPLTLHNLGTAFLVLVELSTKCWLISNGRFADLAEYTQTHNRQFDEESGLIISNITYNSPVNIQLNFSMENVAKSVQIIIDAVIGAKERKKKLELENKKLETEIKKEEQDMQLKVENNSIERQKLLIGLYDRQLDLKRKQIDLFDYASEKVSEIVEMLNPNAGVEDKKIASNSLVKGILGLEEANGLELILPLPQESSRQIDIADSE